MTPVQDLARQGPAPGLAAAERPRVIVLVGYHYLSTPMYQALKRQLPEYDVFYVNAKDTIGSDSNFTTFDRSPLKANDPDYRELPYDPPWFRAWPGAWHSESRPRRLMRWMRWAVAFGPYKRELLRLVEELRPDLIVATTDLWFAPRYLAQRLLPVPIVVMQPCHLDLWERPSRFSILKLVVNSVQPGVFARQDYFGLEIKRAALLVWEPDALAKYARLGRSATPMVSPTHVDLREQATRLRNQRETILTEMGLRGPVVSVFPAYYGDVKGHGPDYQHELEQALVGLVDRLRVAFTVVVKLHPNEQASYWNKVFEQFAGAPNVRLVQQIDRFKLMAVSEYHVSTNSYSAVEATLAGAVAVNFVPGLHRLGEAFCAPFHRNAALVFTSADETARTLLGAPQGGTTFRREIADAQERILGAKAGYRHVRDIFAELLTARRVRWGRSA